MVIWSATCFQQKVFILINSQAYLEIIYVSHIKAYLKLFETETTVPNSKINYFLSNSVVKWINGELTH